MIFNPLKAHRRVAVTVLALFVSSLATARAVIPTRTVTHYTVSAMGISIGDVTTTQQATEEDGVPHFHFETRTVVNASFLWTGYHQNSVEKGTLKKGTLVSYSRVGQENGSAVDIQGQLDETSFRFTIHEHGMTRSVSIPRSSYTATTMECPEARLDFTDKTRHSLNILDVEKMEVVRRDYHLVKNSSYPIGDKELPCRIVEFSDRNKRSKRWISWDGTAVLMFRQDGSGGSSPYSVKAISLRRE